MRRHTRHLSFKIFTAFVVVLIVAVVVTFGAVHLTDPRPMAPDYVKAMASFIADEMSELDPDKREVKIAALGEKMKLRFAFYDRDGNKLVATPGAPHLPSDRSPEGDVFHSDKGMAIVFKLEDGRWVTATSSRLQHHPLWRVVLGLFVFASTLAVGAFFVSRRITGRLERLQDAAEKWGTKEQPENVLVEGNDEVARLAISFNEAGDRIKSLLNQQRNFLANASHELRTPLARIRLASEILAGDGDQQSKERTLEGVNDDINELDGLVADILLAVQMDDHPVKEEELEPVGLLQLAQDQAARFEASVTGENVLVKGDRIKLKRLIVNLLDNAAKYAKGEPTEITVGIEENFAIIEMSDRGPGVSPDDQQSIFEPFYQGGADKKEGYGLGLSLARKIAESHGGSISYTNREGGGATFTVRLPIIEQQQT